MRLKAKVDLGQKEIVAALRAAGVLVYPTHQVGHGFPDLVACYRRRIVLLEVKGEHGKLTADEKLFFQEWDWPRAPLYVVRTPAEALEAVGATTYGLYK